jgi:hypothetical protein
VLKSCSLQWPNHSICSNPSASVLRFSEVSTNEAILRAVWVPGASHIRRMLSNVFLRVLPVDLPAPLEVRCPPVQKAEDPGSACPTGSPLSCSESRGPGIYLSYWQPAVLFGKQITRCEIPLPSATKPKFIVFLPVTLVDYHFKIIAIL